MNNNIKISLIFACYNVSQYLENLYKLLILQPYQNIEIIFVEDCSTDNTRDLLRGFTDSRVKLIENPVNQGASISRNIGITHATGDYLWFPDPDDLFDEKLINEACDIINQYKPSVVICGMREEYEYDGKLEYTKDIVSSYSGVITNHLSNVFVNLEETFLFGYTNNKFYKADIIFKYNIRNKPLALKEDFDFNIQFFKIVNDLYILNKPYYFYKKRNNTSLTNRFVKEYFDIHMESLFQFKELIETKYTIDDNIKRLLVNRFIRYFLSAIERNANSKSKLTLLEQINWIRKVLSNEMYKWFFDNINFLSGKFKILKLFINNKFSFPLVCVGYTLKIMKNKFPIIFVKMKS